MGYFEAADAQAAEKQFNALLNQLDLEDHNLYTVFSGNYVDVEELDDKEWERENEPDLAGFYATTPDVNLDPPVSLVTDISQGKKGTK